MSTPTLLIASLALMQVTAPVENTQSPAATTPGPTPAPIARHWPAAIVAIGRYESLRQSIKATARTPAHSAQDVETIMQTLASYDGKTLANAWTAQAIRTAAQSNAFRQGVNTWSRAYGRNVVAGWLRQNPAYVMTVPGHDDAVKRILRGAQNDAQEVELAAGIYHDLAYSTQHQSWAKKVNHGKTMLLALLRDAPASQAPVPTALLQSVAAYPEDKKIAPQTRKKPLYTGIWRLTGLHFGSAKKPAAPAKISTKPEPEAAPDPVLNTQYNRDMAHVLSTLAIAYLQQPDSRNAVDTNSLPLPASADSKLAECVDWAHMHLNQCVAATHFVYENLFCIAEHQLKDLGLCIGNMASAPAPQATAPILVAEKKPEAVATAATSDDAADDDFSDDDFGSLNANVQK